MLCKMLKYPNCICLCARVRMHACICGHVCVNTCVCTCACTCMYVCMWHVHMCVHVHVCAYMCMCTCVRACVHACVYTYLLGLHPVVLHHASIRVLLLVRLDALTNTSDTVSGSVRRVTTSLSDMSPLYSISNVTTVCY